MTQKSSLPLKSAYLAVQASAAIDDCTSLLNQTETLLEYVVNDNENITSQSASLQRHRRAVNTTRRQLEMRLRRQSIYDEWTAIVRSFNPKDAQEQINAELAAIEAITTEQDGLQVTINRLQIATEKLRFFEEHLTNAIDHITL
ncbi:hypothetical protein AB6A40_010915 [Gnathostoma spinigerum]|uniref:Uncharacterized protein n=1 Tax=Gnathostoma spinigerum TaxID=75299 RepID=A0ABD6F227_9BILA